MRNARMKVGKIDGPPNRDGTVTLSVWSGPLGREADSGETLVATDCLMPGDENIREGANAIVIYEAGEWYIHSIECP